MKVKTSSGFKYEINENKLKDWDFAKAIAKCDSGDESKIIEGMTFVVPFMLGDDGEKALMDHVRDKEGIAATTDILREIKEIIKLVGEEVKKSASLPE